MKFTLRDAELLQSIFSSRRDVRGNRFIDEPIDDEVLRKILEAAISAPSVGFSQPWKFVIVQDHAKREAIYEEFLRENTKASKLFEGNLLYDTLKLEGIKESALNIAVLYQKPTKTVLGQTTQKKMGEYSVVCAIQNLWLMARAHNIGVGWVSILRPKKVKKILGIGDEYKLIGYLTMGYVSEFLEEPELLKMGWEERKTLDEVVEWV
ncbi:MAG: 5,6-dimethylbenzimidazole synthase [Sulfuricurvum sp. GWF2_44_89]|uniref:5,6-dimethylbenzimidazole synthase n=1 Tax=Sulfuricurvum kujiense TaxID=148813 RepID=A0A2D3WGA3_9BACT|nr:MULTISPECIES: 5,6-dimethylbenzimidazole synthase [Sulfuricurvum]OHD78701.1 MAG: 5,6-dimethylbenzimidazole synthase [Sulfuricurvum sp. GWF2_44_89]OHD91423.1 MAG: 5,6-dimethylbenzimidazole synthase [Sulfuricurvum sp. RIFOXYD12_FULL_44_77]OHD95879.1 MAG: 5,6-dimethylbenzimidazole synthase [Sulfuricurvum sp. RIFOXYD2_FULL_44_160]DAB39448.1 MAG TPA: 5,6-dimethylbenzimidazole synthase [Sulfuricurvum kujiense]